MVKNPEARTWARRVNEFSAQVAADHPGRFGFFATLTLPDLDGALEEARYALDVLNASGVILLANTHGTYLGDPSHEPLLEELGRRHAVVFVHPSELPCAAVPGIPTFAADFLLDTTRAAYQLVAHGCVRRHPELRIILSHAGGFVPYASHRMAIAIAEQLGPKLDDVLNDFRSFYFDTALSGSPAALPSLLAFAKPDHVLFGSDWPFAPEAAVGYFTYQLDAYAALDGIAREALDRGNASRLFPHLPA
jgi:predicted TIM-barrel fold metal-dependent hydrolase